MGGNGASHFLGVPGISLEHLGGFNVFCQLLTPDLWGDDPIGRGTIFFKWVAFTHLAIFFLESHRHPKAFVQESTGFLLDEEATEVSEGGRKVMVDFWTPFLS